MREMYFTVQRKTFKFKMMQSCQISSIRLENRGILYSQRCPIRPKQSESRLENVQNAAHINDA